MSHEPTIRVCIQRIIVCCDVEKYLLLTFVRPGAGAELYGEIPGPHKCIIRFSNSVNKLSAP